MLRLGSAVGVELPAHFPGAIDEHHGDRLFRLDAARGAVDADRRRRREDGTSVRRGGRFDADAGGHREDAELLRGSVEEEHLLFLLRGIEREVRHEDQRAVGGRGGESLLESQDGLRALREIRRVDVELSVRDRDEALARACDRARDRRRGFEGRAVVDVEEPHRVGLRRRRGGRGRIVFEIAERRLRVRLRDLRDVALRDEEVVALDRGPLPDFPGVGESDEDRAIAAFFPGLGDHRRRSSVGREIAARRVVAPQRFRVHRLSVGAEDRRGRRHQLLEGLARRSRDEERASGLRRVARNFGQQVVGISRDLLQPSAGHGFVHE